LPEVLAIQARKYMKEEGEEVDEGSVRETAAHHIERVLRGLGLDDLDISWMADAPELVAILGGKEYLKAHWKWRAEEVAAREAYREARDKWDKEVRAWTRSRKKDKGPMPPLTPPARPPLHRVAPALPADTKPTKPPMEAKPVTPVRDSTGYVAPDDAW
jgi:hypothetical protein